MAKKGQKFSKYTDESFKFEIVKKYLSLISSTYLSKEYNIPIKTWTIKYRKHGNLTNDILKRLKSKVRSKIKK